MWQLNECASLSLTCISVCGGVTAMTEHPMVPWTTAQPGWCCPSQH